MGVKRWNAVRLPSLHAQATTAVQSPLANNFPGKNLPVPWQKPAGEIYGWYTLTRSMMIFSMPACLSKPKSRTPSSTA